MGGLSIWHLLVVLVIVLVVFGTKRLRSIGSDLGGAIKSFRQSVKEEGEASDKSEQPGQNKAGGETRNETGRIIEGEATREKDKV